MVASKKDDRLGKTFKTNRYGNVVVTEYRNALNVVVEFTETGFRTETTFQKIKSGEIRDPLAKTFYGVGYIGVGSHKYSDRENGTSKIPTVSSRWVNMLRRCYDKEYQDRYLKGYYEGCEVCEEWHNFQNFAEWFYSQPNCFEKGYEIDKDLTIIGNTVYSPTTCSLIPSEINGFITYQPIGRLLPYGVVVQNSKGNPYVARIKYKGKLQIIGYFKTVEDAYNAACSAKNGFIKELALEYREVLNNEIYKNLMSFSMDNFINARKQNELLNKEE